MDFRSFRKAFKEQDPAYLTELQKLFSDGNFEDLFKYYLFISEQEHQYQESISPELEGLTNEILETVTSKIKANTLNPQSRRLTFFTRLNTPLCKKLILSIDRKNFDPVVVILNKSAESKQLKDELKKLHIPCRLEESSIDLLQQLEMLNSILIEEDAGTIFNFGSKVDLDLCCLSTVYNDIAISSYTDNPFRTAKTINLKPLQGGFWNTNRAIPDFRTVSVFECWNDISLPQEVIDYAKKAEQLCLFTQNPLELFEDLPESDVKNFSFTSNPLEFETIMKSCGEVLAVTDKIETPMEMARQYGCDLRNLSTGRKWLYESIVKKFDASRKFKVSVNELTKKVSQNKRKTPRLVHFRHDHSAPIIKHISTDISNALRNLGVDLLEIDLSNLHQANHLKQENTVNEEREKIMKKLKQFKPDQALGYNAFGIFPSGDSHLLEKMEIPYNGLFFDNPFYSKTLINNTSNKDMVRVFTLDKGLLPLLKDCGFRNSRYFPIATSAQRFSMKPGKAPKTQLLFTSTVKPLKTVDDLTKACKSQADAYFVEFAFPKLLRGEISFQKILDDYYSETGKTYYPPDFYSFIETWFKLDLQVTTHTRLKIVNALRDYEMHIYGGSHWKEFHIPEKHTYMNFLNYRSLPSVARAANLTVCSSPINIQDGIQQRILDCGAMQASIITDYRPILERHFKLDEELFVYRNTQELKEKTDFLLKTPGAREKAIKKLYNNVMQNHTWERRMDEFLNMI